MVKICLNAREVVLDESAVDPACYFGYNAGVTLHKIAGAVSGCLNREQYVSLLFAFLQGTSIIFIVRTKMEPSIEKTI